MDKLVGIQTLQAKCTSSAGGVSEENMKVNRSDVAKAPDLGQALVRRAQGAANVAGSQTQASAGSAPLDTVVQFVSSLMGHDYEAALLLCKQIMEREPRNKVALEFYPLLLKKNIEAIENEGKGSSETGSDGDSDSGSNSSYDSSPATSRASSCHSSSTCSRSNDSGEDSSSDEESSGSDNDENEHGSDKDEAGFAYEVQIVKTRL